MPITKPRAVREPLSRERIEEAALKLIEDVGYADFSTRKLAAELGCEAMSIYHYFPSKAHLRDAILDRLVAAMPIPPRELPWLERMRQVAIAYRASALGHPRFYEHAVLHRMNTAAGLRMLENVLAIFIDAGFGSEMAARLFRAFGYYVAGAALDEAAGYARGHTAMEPVPDDVAAVEYPLVTAVNPYFKRAHHQATFELGLEIMLEGIARLHKATVGKNPAVPAVAKRQAARRAAKAIIT